MMMMMMMFVDITVTTAASINNNISRRGLTILFGPISEISSPFLFQLESKSNSKYLLFD
jgi:hypothetical protein